MIKYSPAAKIEKIYWFIAASLMLLVLDYLTILNPIKRPIDLVVIPVKSEIYTKTYLIKNLVEAFWQSPQLGRVLREKEKLAKREEELSLKIKLLTEENKRLRIQLEAPLPPSYKFVPANVVSLSRFMELDVGGRHGVAIGMTVVDGQSLVGKVVSVSASRSNIMLPIDTELSVPAKTLSGTRGIIAGRAGDNVFFEKVLQKEPLFLDDQVITSGEDGYPANLLIGKIVHINAPETSIYKQAKIATALNYEGEQIVFVVTSF